MNHLSLITGVDRFGGGNFDIDVSPLAADASKHGCKSVVIILTPTLCGMMVTLGTLNADSQECLSDGFHIVLIRSDSSIPKRCRVFLLASRGG